MSQKELNIVDIKQVLPHRYPFLLIDKITDFQEGSHAIGLKNVTINEPFFQGHFPDNPIMPGVLILEALAQTGGAILLKDPEFAGRYAYFASMDKVKFRVPVVPGDRLRLEMHILKTRSNFIKMEGRALVEGRIVCEGIFTFTLAHEQTKPQIHGTATVHRTAILGKNVKIGPNSIIGEHVIIGDDTIVEGHCFIEKWTQIGKNCHVHFGCVIGSSAQDIKYKGEKSWVVIGDRNIIREYVTINRATGKDTITQIGHDNIFLTNVHIAHNCVLGNNIIIANMTNLGGHTHVEDRAVIGGMTGVHQFVRIGRGAMVGAYTRLPQDVPPFMLCEGNPAGIRGLNLVGMKRGGLSKETILEVKAIHKELYRSDQNTTQAIETLKSHHCTTPEANHLLQFIITETSRGLLKKGIRHEQNDEE